MSKFNIGDKVRHTADGSGPYLVVVAEPDRNGYIVLSDRGSYLIRPEQSYELAPKRYTVEYRAPQGGERFFAAVGGGILTASGGKGRRDPRFVIVEEL